MPAAKILIIDDEPMIRWAIAETLRSCGHQVAGSGTAKQGMVLFQEFRPDVVFLDLRLPDGDGLALFRQMAAERERHSAVVLMTAHAETCSATEAENLGAAAFLTKPFDFRELPGLVGRALAKAGA